MRASLLVLSVLALLPAEAASLQEDGSSATSALFRSDAPLTVRIEADFDAIEGDRSQESEEREGRFVLVAEDGTETVVPVDIRTRGNFRLQRSTCRFPPLRLDFPRGDLGGTILDGENRLKLVTHCRDSDRFEAMALKEYLIYRAYNLFTDASFRVRLARITYTKPEEGPVAERWGFLIEDDDLLAERLGGEKLDVEGQLHPSRIAGVHEGRVALFQYMVGNTDYSLFFGHNVELVTDAEGFVLPIPYDFDWSGLVNAPYARPAEMIGTRHVRERVYRGLCRPDVSYGALYADFLERRDAVLALFRSEERLPADEREEAVEYLEEFFETIEDEDTARRRIEESCLSTRS